MRASAATGGTRPAFARHAAARRSVVVAALLSLVLTQLLAGTGASAAPLAPVTAAAEATNPVWGYADLHSHQFGNLGFGGLAVWGDVYSPDGDPEKALSWSDFMPAGPLDVVGLGDLPVVPTPMPFWRPGCPFPTGNPLLPCFMVPIHGPFGTADMLNPALGGRYPHAVGGWPLFDGWPAHDVLTTQQVYHEWLERAWRGGLRSMTMLAVNNRTLCSAVYRLRAFGCEDMPAVERQVQAAKDFEAWVDARAGGPGQGWYRIAYSAEQAREIARTGKLVVTLGVEVPALFGCTTTGPCSEQDVRDGVQHLYDIGVRHVFPVHNADNAFGGSALYNDIFDLNSLAYNGEWMQIGPCRQNRPDDPLGTANDIDFHMDLRDTINTVGVPAAAAALGPLGAVVAGAAAPPPAPPGAHCNPRGLQPLGRVLIAELMAHQMLIDVDHTSTATFDDILGMAEKARYPGLVTGHTGLIDASLPQGRYTSATNRHEGNKDAQQIKRVRDLGGSVSVILHQGTRDRIAQYKDPTSRTTPAPFGCGDSSEAWVQVYLKATEHMNGAAVGIGSDFNGLAGMPAPRFGPAACKGDQQPGYTPPPGVSYPLEVQPGVTLPASQIGERTFDYNVDGLAHAGLLPDFVADVRQVLGGGTAADRALQPLFGSAEAYLRTWERASDTEPPAVSCDPAPTAWSAEDITVLCRVTDARSDLAPGTPAALTLRTHVPAGEQTATAATDSRTVCDARGNCRLAGPVTGLRVDKRPPSLALLSPRDGQVLDSDAHLPLTVAADDDAGSGLATVTINLDGVPRPVGSSANVLYLDPGRHTVTATARDAVTNTAVTSATFTAAATSVGLSRTLDSLLAAGRVTRDVYEGLHDKLTAAQRSHDRGQHRVEWNQLRAFTNQLRAQSGEGIDAADATRLALHAQDIINRQA